ncbi:MULTISPECIES: hypothetical protein [Paenibacillus]|uniref:hypothetical protein n=1 Tax=Paenibacillus TaxID=44249 RepID=UPI0022B85FBB|nr:hypothetical protein [Paenibacillus caseinilyticus]MCZ8518099.1 hypothetical protein [Paenibacillus caseinilyticus]
MGFAINVFFGTIEFVALIALALSMFRFQFYYYLPKIIGIAFLMSFVSFFFRDIPQMGIFAILTALSIEVILIMIVYRIPFFYSLLVSFCGYTAGLLIELAVVFSGKSMNLFDEKQIQESDLTLTMIQCITALLIWAIIYFLQQRKIGFLFKTKNLSSKTALKGYNFLIASILILGLILAQIELISFYNNKSISMVIISILAVTFLIGILLAYKHNKNIIRETYERPVKDELDRSMRNEMRRNNSK